MGKFIDLTGMKFSRLTVIGMSEGRGNSGGIKWNCVCECDNRLIVISAKLKSGHTQSCGCLRDDKSKSRNGILSQFFKHGMSKTPEYRAWRKLIDRTTNPNGKDAKHYCKRGITVTERWLSFDKFYADMGPKPSPKHSIDRVNNDGNYEPENCRWATMKEQACNKRSNRMIEHNGVTKCVAEWAEYIGINAETIYQRIARGNPEHKWLLPVRRKILAAVKR